MKLNLGSGEMPAEGWVNVDAVRRGRVDLMADVRALPFADGSVEAIYAGHLVEHMYPAEASAAILEWWRVLAPGGELGILVPDVQRFAAIWAQGGFSKDDLLGCIGGERDPADPFALHVSVYTDAQLRWFLMGIVTFERDYADWQPMDQEAWPVVSPSEWQVGYVARK